MAQPDGHAASSSRPIPAAARRSGWVVEVAPRVCVAGAVIGAITVDRMAVQVSNTSGGRLPTPVLASHRWGILKATIAKQAVLTSLQFGSMREIRFLLDVVQPSPALSVMLACGLSGVPCSSLQYNWTIQDTYRYFSRPPPGVRSASDFVRQKVMPGLAWSFARAGCGTGGGLYFGPKVAGALDVRLRAHGLDLPGHATRLLGGLATGACMSLATQGVHNVTLVAGRMAALGATAQAPHYTTVALREAWQEMGSSLFYSNFGPRMAINAVTVATLSCVDIFHCPELSRWSIFGPQ